MMISRRSRFVVAALVAVFVAPALAAAVPRTGYQYLGVWGEVYDLTRKNYVDKVNENDLMQGAYRGLFAALNVGSACLPPGDGAARRRAASLTARSSGCSCPA